MEKAAVPAPPAADAFIFSLRLRDSATIDSAEISREIGRVKWVSIRALMGVSYVRVGKIIITNRSHGVLTAWKRQWKNLLLLPSVAAFYLRGKRITEADSRNNIVVAAAWRSVHRMQ